MSPCSCRVSSQPGRKQAGGWMAHPVQFINTKPWIPSHILMSGNAALIFPAIKNWGENAFLTDEPHNSWMGCPSSHGLWLAVIQMLFVLSRFTMTSVLLSFFFWEIQLISQPQLWRDWVLSSERGFSYFWQMHLRINENSDGQYSVVWGRRPLATSLFLSRHRTPLSQYLGLGWSSD